MKFFTDRKPIRIKLLRDISKHIKRGNPWVFGDALEKYTGDDGTPAILMLKGEPLAFGISSPGINLSFRVLALKGTKFDDGEVERRLERALANRSHLLTSENQCLRLINGEGDELPGVVADYYDGVVVLKFDGQSCENFWKKEAFADYFMSRSTLPVRCVYFKRKNREEDKGEIIAGSVDALREVDFLEHGVRFRTDVIDAAKTGFFLDQRENRDFIRSVAKSKTLLNLFGYTGGFSVYAGLGGASAVTTVDIAPAAIEAAKVNWSLNLPSGKHEALCEDAFAFVERAQAQKLQWDIVITDPPSFAPNQKAVENAIAAYTRIFADSLRLVKTGGFFAASSCSGHIGFEDFLQIVQEALSKSRCRGKVLLVKGQPEDHPFPMALSEMRYLKFVYLQIFRD